MSLFKIVNKILQGVIRLVLRVDKKTLKAVPRKGPLILVGNHVSFLEAPVAFAFMDNPDLVGISKRENWNNPIFNFLFTIWKIIPIDRGEVDREAFRLSEDALAEGKVLAVFPEGTRSNDGQLQQGKSGVVALAMRSKAPLFPIVFYGYENFWQNLKKLKRTEFNVAIGKPFQIDMQGRALSRDVRQEVTDEIMYKLAEILPEKYRGYYQFDGKVNYQYLVDL